MFKSLNFQSLPVKDIDRAVAFYRDTLGLVVQTDAPMGDGWRWVFMQIPGAETMIHFAHAEEITIKGIPALALVSDDVDAEAARLKEMGVVFREDPKQAEWHPGVRYALIRDSEDNTLMIQSSIHEGA